MTHSGEQPLRRTDESKRFGVELTPHVRTVLGHLQSMQNERQWRTKGHAFNPEWEARLEKFVQAFFMVAQTFRLDD